MKSIGEVLSVENVALLGLGALLAKFLTPKKEDQERQLPELKLYKSKHGLENPEYSMIVREQLVRNYQFFGEEAQNKIRNSYILIVGLGARGR
jgi:hypothetical protein